MADKTLISIIIPCRNEERFIAACLDCVLAFKMPEDCSSEILIIDGMSEDASRSIINEYSLKHTCIRLIENKKKIQACALNIGIREAKGEYILRLDAHSEYGDDYLLKLYATAKRTGADNTGGLVITKPYNDSYHAAVVQALTTHVFGVGNSGFRVGMKEGPADTVPFGFFRKGIFDKIGFFDERLIRAQDYEFNRRIVEKGGKVWLNPDIQLDYFNQPDISKFLKKQFFKEAPYNAYMWYLAPYTFAFRHAITAVFSFGILAGIALSFFVPVISYLFAGAISLYFLLAAVSSIQQAIRFKKAAHIFVLPLCFFLYHFLHGIGVMWGLLRLLTGTSPFKRMKEPWPGANKFRAID